MLHPTILGNCSCLLPDIRLKRPSRLSISRHVPKTHLSLRNQFLNFIASQSNPERPTPSSCLEPSLPLLLKFLCQTSGDCHHPARADAMCCPTCTASIAPGSSLVIRSVASVLRGCQAAPECIQPGSDSSLDTRAEHGSAERDGQLRLFPATRSPPSSTGSPFTLLFDCYYPIQLGLSSSVDILWIL